MCNCRIYHFVETVRRFCLHRTGHQITTYTCTWFLTSATFWASVEQLRNHCENPQYVVSHSVGQYLFFLLLLVYVLILIVIRGISSELKGNHFFEKKMPSVFKSQPIWFNFDLPFQQNNYRSGSAFCLLDSLRPINNLSVMWGRVVLGWTSTKLGLMCLAQGHNTVALVKLEPVAPPSRVKLSTTEPLRSPDSAVTMRRTGPAKYPRGRT